MALFRARGVLTRRRVARWGLCGLAAWMSIFPVHVALAALAADDTGSPPPPDDPRVTLSSSNPAEPQFDFDLPAQPLASALNRFADVSGRAALFSSTLVAGRTASPVQGRLAPREALQRLLEGTGLAMEEVGAGRVNAFVLKPLGAQAQAAANARARLERYDGMVQARVWDALCADARTAQGDYRSLLRFRVDAAGRVHRAQLLGSTGDTRRDAVLVATLERVRIDRPPPPDMKQPLAMLILPAQAGGPSCEDAARP